MESIRTLTKLLNRIRTWIWGILLILSISTTTLNLILIIDKILMPNIPKPKRGTRQIKWTLLKMRGNSTIRIILQIKIIKEYHGSDPGNPIPLKIYIQAASTKNYACKKDNQI